MLSVIRKIVGERLAHKELSKVGVADKACICNSTATISRMMKTPIFLMAMFAGFTLFAADGGFLFATFKGEQTPMTEQIYFALSKEGRQWTALKGGEPVLV